jgi:hypothetical protein
VKKRNWEDIRSEAEEKEAERMVEGKRMKKIRGGKGRDRGLRRKGNMKRGKDERERERGVPPPPFPTFNTRY